MSLRYGRDAVGLHHPIPNCRRGWRSGDKPAAPMIDILERPPLRNRAVPSLALLIAVTMTGTMAMHIFVPAMPAAAADLGASPSLIQSTITLYIVGLAAGQLIYGPLSDRFGRRPVLLFSLAVYVLGLVLAIPVASVGALIGARVLQSPKRAAPSFSVVRWSATAALARMPCAVSRR
jgi:MFS family permease